MTVLDNLGDEYRQEPERRTKFDPEVLTRKGRFAIAALPTEQEIAKDGNIIGGSNGLKASETMR